MSELETKNTNPQPPIEEKGKTNWVSIIGMGLFAFVAISVIVQNWDPIEIEFLKWNFDAPLLLLMAVFFLGGFLVAWILQGKKIRAKNKELKEIAKK